MVKKKTVVKNAKAKVAEKTISVTVEYPEGSSYDRKYANAVEILRSPIESMMVLRFSVLPEANMKEIENLKTLKAEPVAKLELPKDTLFKMYNLIGGLLTDEEKERLRKS